MARRGVGRKALQLRVMAIIRSAATQDGACQQRFTPQRDPALRIEIPGMDRPESHLGAACGTPRNRAASQGSQSMTSRPIAIHPPALGS